MKTKQIFPFLLIVCLLVGNSLFAQSKIDERFNAFSQLLSPEKLYLQTDKETYCVGDTLWFKGYLVNNSLLSEFPESNFIYVELLTYYYNKNVYSNRVEEATRTVQRVKIKRRNGVLQGYIVLDSDMNTGVSILRAYTYWGLNFPVDYIFTRRITVINPIKDNFVKDLVEHKVRETEEYTKVGVQNPFKREKVANEKIDCQFLPESGRYFANVKTKIGVKSINEEGFGEKVTGEVFTSDGKKITEFETNDLGMGSFAFTAESGKKYYAIVKDNRGVEEKIDLPAISSTGAQINVSRRGDNFIAELYATPNLNADSLRFILSNGSEIFYDGAFSQSTRVALPILKMAEGINVATIADNQGNVYAKRPLFVLPADEGNVDIKTDKDIYSQRELVTCTIDLNKPVSGNFSVAVTDDNHAPYTGVENNIISYMLLSSEIKGYVENPQHYFDRSVPVAEREKDLDLMMMTQGWEYYDLPAIFKAQFELPQFGKEYIQTISGRVRKASLRKGKSSIVSFVAPSIGFTAMGQLDSSGYFELKDIDFPDSTLFIVNAVGTGGRKSFIPSISEDSFAPLLKYNVHKQKVNYSDDDAQYMIQNYYNTGGEKVYQLDPVYVTSQRMVKANDNLSPFPVQYFKQGQLKTEDDLKPFIGYDVMTYVIETCQGIRFSTDTVTGERKLVSRVAGIASNWETEDMAEVVVFINGFQATSSSELDHYSVDELEAFVHLQGADAAPFVPMMDGSASLRRVIMIKTKPSAKTGMPKNVTKGYPLGWQRPKSFYSPAYEVYGKGLVRYGTDKRSTVYWNPNIVVEEGKGGFKFNTSDGNSNYTVVLEGITNEGEYIFKKVAIKRKSDY